MGRHCNSFHKSLWNKDFIALATAEMALTASVYMQLPLLLQRHIDDGHMTTTDCAIGVALFAIGMFAIGPFTNWLIQRYRRNKVFMSSATGMVAIMLLQSIFTSEKLAINTLNGYLFTVSCFAYGGLYSLSKRTLTGVLMVDKCISANRSAANIAASWVSRLSLAVGPSIAIMATAFNIVSDTGIIDKICVVAAVLLVATVRFPFKTPDDNVSILSADRFFRLRSLSCFVMLAVVYVIVGLIFTHERSATFFLMLTVGVIISMITVRLFSLRTNVASVIIGVACLLASLLNVSAAEFELHANFAMPLALGCAIGYLGSFALHKYIDTGFHCERSTAVSSYFLACEGGLAIGVSLGCFYFDSPLLDCLHDMTYYL